MAQSKLVLLFVACLVVTLLPFRNLSAQPLSAHSLFTEDAVVQGTLTFDKRYVAVQPLIPGQPMRVVMAFDPQDQQELRRRSGFFVLDGDRLRRFFAGGSLLDNNLAAGSQTSDSAANELVAVIDQPSGEYTVVIYNDTDIPMHFRLSVENGGFPGEVSQPSQPAEDPAGISAANSAAPAPAQVQAQPAKPAQPQPAQPQSIAASQETGGDSIYTVQAGDTLGLIAQTLYGDLSLYSRLCSYNGIGDCNLIEVGRQLHTPPLAQLSGTAATTAQERSPVASAQNLAVQNVAAPAPGPVGDSYTVAAGDTLGTIAQKLYGDFQRFREICTLNGLSDCNIVSVGQVLRLPGGSNAQSATPVAATSAPSQPEATALSAAVQTSNVGVVPTLEGTNDKSVFLSLWNSTGLLALLETDGPFTLFVPSDAAFAPVLETSLDMWMENKQVLERILSYHVLLQSFDASGLTGVVELPTLEGSTVRAERTARGDLLVNGAQAIETPINASNGMIYTIDQVLSPPTP